MRSNCSKVPALTWRCAPARRWFCTCAVATFVFALHLTWHEGLLAQGVDYRLGVGHTAGELVGLDDGYTRFDSFLPLVQPTDDTLLFADVRFLLFNEQTEADGVNLGFGGRAYDPATDRILGGYFYYDYRDTGYSNYNQLSWGFESLGSVWDFRAGAYLPIGNTWNNYLDHSASTTFIGPHLFFTDIEQEVALRGVDGEAVMLLVDRGWWQLRGGGGIYGYWHENAGVTAVGPKLRLELRVADQLWLGGSVQHDDEFDTTAAITISWRYGLTRHFEPCPSSESVHCRLGDPVQRNDQVAIKRYVGGLSTAKVVRAPDGHAYTFHHVDSNAESGGNGTIESPTNNLAAASNQPEDIVLVHGGSEFTGHAFATSTEGQRVLAEGVEHTLVTKQLGEINLPTVSSGPAPVIRNSLGDAITIAADGVEVSGFEIVDPGPRLLYYYGTGGLIDAGDYGGDVYYPYPVLATSSGIVATGVSDININRNFISGASDSGIEVSSLGGVNRIHANAIVESARDGISVYGDYTGTLASNLTEDNGWTGIYASGNVEGDIVDNYTALNSTGGIVVEGNVVGDVRSNLATDNHASGIRVNGSVTGSVVGNQVDQTGEPQILLHIPPLYFTDDVGATGGGSEDTAENEDLEFVLDAPLLYTDGYVKAPEVAEDANTETGDLEYVLDAPLLYTTRAPTEDDTGSGDLEFELDAPLMYLSTASIRTHSANPGTGIEIGGDVGGEVSHNMANNNYGYGMRIDGDIDGELKNNIGNSNTQSGLHVDGVVYGNAVSNEASFNGRNGVYARTFMGDVMENHASHNTNAGILTQAVHGTESGNTGEGNAYEPDVTIEGAPFPNPPILYNNGGSGG